MKNPSTFSNSPVENTSRHYRRQVTSAVARLKERLISRYEKLAPDNSLRIRNAVAEAELRAWAMPFPHLFLPAFVEQQLAKVLAPNQLVFAHAG